VIASTVPVDKPLQCRLDLEALPAAQEGVRQMKEHVAMDDLCRTA